MSLIISPQKMTFDHQEKVKYVKLTNTTIKNGQPRPIMFKIKTNKIELVDAKPSCGYISGKPGHNEINVAIRWLNNTNDNSAKLQILFVENSRITEEMVERNSAYFDNDEYTQNLEAIKKENQNDVKTLLLPVNRKVKEEPKPLKESEFKQVKNEFTSVKIPAPSPPNLKNRGSVNNEQVEVPSSNNKSSGISLTKCLVFVFAAFLIGLLAGYSIGKKQFKQAVLVSQNSQVKSQEPRTVEEMVTSERVQKSESSETVEESVPLASEDENRGSGLSSDLNEFAAEQQTNENPSTNPSESTTTQEAQAISVEQDL